jgi:hypothetical protein
VDGHNGASFTLVDSGQTLGSCCLGTRSIPSSLTLIGHKLCKCTTLFNPVFLPNTVSIRGPGSSVGIATDYGLDGPGIKSWWGRDFPPIQTGPGVHPASCTMGTSSFPGVKCGWGVLLTTHPLLAPKSWKSRAIPPPTSRPQLGL